MTAEIGPNVVVGNAFRIIKHHQQGGMGQIYLAEEARKDSGVRRPVAIKVLRRDLDIEPKEFRKLEASFRLEAHIGGLLRHPNIVQVLQDGLHESTERWLAFEWLGDYETLTTWIFRRALLSETERFFAPEWIKTVLLQVVRAMEEVHRHNIRHRDLSPNNILVLEVEGDQSQVKVSDFGVASFKDSPLAVSETDVDSVAAGTPTYLAPDYYRHKDWDHRVDIWSIGAVLYKLLTLSDAYRACSAKEAKEIFENPPPLTFPEAVRNHYATGLGAGLLHICTKALAIDRQLRYQSCRELRRDLERGDFLPFERQAASSTKDSAPKSVRPQSFARAIGIAVFDTQHPAALAGLAAEGAKRVEAEPEPGVSTSSSSGHCASSDTQGAAVSAASSVRSFRITTLRRRDLIAIGVVLLALVGGALVVSAVPPSSRRRVAAAPSNDFAEPPRPRVTGDEIATDRRESRRYFFNGSTAEAPANLSEHPSPSAPSTQDPAAPPPPVEQETRGEGDPSKAANGLPSQPSSTSSSAAAASSKVTNRGGLHARGPSHDTAATASTDGAAGGSNGNGSAHGSGNGSDGGANDEQPAGTSALRAGLPTESALHSRADAREPKTAENFNVFTDATVTPPSELKFHRADDQQTPQIPTGKDPMGIKTDALIPAVILNGLSSHRPGTIVIAQLLQDVPVSHGRTIPAGSRLTGTIKNGFYLRGDSACYADVQFDTLLLPGRDTPARSVTAIATVDGQAGLPCRLHGKIDRRRQSALTEGLIDVAKDLVASETDTGGKLAGRVLEVEREDARTLLTDKDPPATIAARKRCQIQFTSYQ